MASPPSDQRLLQSALDGRYLPPYLPLEPSDVAAGVAAAEVVPIVLDAIRAAHGIERWDPVTYENVFLRAAMAAWHEGDLDVARDERGLTVRTRVCPVAVEARSDARVCQMCRALHALAAQEAFRWRLRGITFPQLLTRDAPTCEMRVEVATA